LRLVTENRSVDRQMLLLPLKLHKKATEKKENDMRDYFTKLFSSCGKKGGNFSFSSATMTSAGVGIDRHISRDDAQLRT